MTTTNIRAVKPFGSLFVAEYRIRRMMKFKWLIVATSIGNPFLYLLSIGIGIGALIDANNLIDGVPYLTFLAPALLANAAIAGGMEETVFPTLLGFKWAKLFFGMNSTPLTGNQIALGVFFAAIARVTFLVTIYWLILYWFGALTGPQAWLAIPTAIFAGACFAAMMLALAARIENDDFFFTFVSRFVIVPLFLFSGTFFPLTAMPIYLQWIGWISPLWHATELGRFLTYGREISTEMLILHTTFLAAILGIGLYFALKLYTRRLTK
jgi:lipooligosaccharide transport system permease protein